MRVKFVVSLALLVASAAPAAAPKSPTQFQTRILALHNAQRAEVRLPPLAWDDSLAAGAQAWADHMAATGQFDHSDRHARRGIGENIWNGTRGSYTVEDGVRTWISDRRNFVPGVFPNVSISGWYSVSHYTQIIWPKTTRIGCGMASSSSSDYLVCRYSPAGNIDGVHVP
ncbi:MAG TPA: CAP domain-containing protein [Sphingomicrobium sp.]